MDAQEFALKLLRYIDDSPSPWHAVATTRQHLVAAGFQPLEEQKPWALKPGAGYFVIRDDSSIIAFRLGTGRPSESGFRILGAHTDSPGLRIKPNPVKRCQEWLTLGVEVYGGPILPTFTDRDLSLAGRVVIRDDDGNLTRKLVRFEQAIVRIPNLAIHLNRTVNEDGLKLNPQTELPLILSLVNESDTDPFGSIIAQTLNVDPSTILAWEMAVYDTQPGTLWGPENEFLANSQLDNLAMCHAALESLLSAVPSASTQVIALFDHEEVGSGSDKGADGNFLRDVLQRIVAVTEDTSVQNIQQALANSIMISADMAHAWHPNYPHKHDPEHRPIVNQGPVIKINHNQRYTTDAVTEAMFIALCQDHEIPYQKFINRTDLSCGSTIGPMTAASLGIASLDIGNAQWAMHSIRESAGVQDHLWMKMAMTAFLNSAK